MSRFHPLIVTDLRKTTRDAVAVTLMPPDGADFSFLPGQYLTFRRDFDGTELRRCYSICAAPAEGVLRVGIKAVEGGAFSTWANEALRPGMVLEAMAPMGTFHSPLDPAQTRSYLAFAGGSGITPILSIITGVLETEPHSRVTLVYANRRMSTIMFREEIDDFKNRYMDRFNVIHILDSDAQEIDLFQGRVDTEKCAQLFSHVIDVADIDVAFVCGPEPMMLTVAQALQDHGMEKDRIKIERFVGQQTGQLAQAARTAATASDVRVAARVTIDGVTRSFDMDRATSVLDAALANDLGVPFACKAGVCSTCKCRVLEGEVEMMANHALEDYEVRAGYILSCQSFPVTDRLVLTYEV